MADEQKNVNLEDAARGGNGTSTQTRASGSDTGAGNGKPAGGEGGGTGTGDGGASGGSGGDQALTPDSDGKVVHPETKEKVDPIVVATYYRDKFGASTQGAQELLTKVSTAEGERDTYKGEIATLTTKIAELTQIAEGKNPEGLKASEIQAKLTETTKQLALVQESQSLDSFERTTPLATGKLRESLKALARANPTASLQSLWDANLKAGAEATAAADKARIDAQKKGAGEDGRGTSTREPGGGGNTIRGAKGDTGKTLEEFNALPVVQRKQLIDKFDIRM